MEILVGMAKIGKNGSAVGSDGFAVAERPGGGISVLLADNAGSGRSIQDVGHIMAAKAALLISEGVRDSMVPRTLHDYLQEEKEGKVAVMLTIISIDTEAQMIFFARNCVCPLFIRHEFGVDCHEDAGSPLGTQKNVKPVVSHIPLSEGLLVATFSDGVMLAGRKQGRSLDMAAITRLLEKSSPEDAQFIAEDILSRALLLDGYQPNDHMMAICVGVSDKESDNKVQKRTANFPL